MLNDGYILTAAEMQQAEQTVMDSGISIDELMLRAGRGAAQNIWRFSGDMPTLVLCGPGNNGGDGYVIAQWLLDKGVNVKVAALCEPKTKAAQNAKSHWKGQTVAASEAAPSSSFVDCLFGTGLTRPVEGAAFDAYQRLAKAAKLRFAIDMPSGIETDPGALLNSVPQFDFTLALGGFKPAHYLEPAKSRMGEIIGVDIGITARSQLKLIDKPDIKAPGDQSHKYSRGLVAIVAGEMHGAAKLSALAAQRSGAGYVKIFARPGFISPNHSIVVEYFESPAQLNEKLSDRHISTIVIGPGLGRDEKAHDLLDTALDRNKPMILDADALFILGEGAVQKIQKSPAESIITPHAGEFAKIAQNSDDSKINQVRNLSKSSNAVVLLKGTDTVISDPDGNTRISSEDCSWLSTAGTGDVLSGIIAARLAIGNDALIAAEQGQWLHTRAAQLAGPVFSPEVLVDQLPAALQQCL